MATKKIKMVVKGPYNPAALTLSNDYLDRRDVEKMQKAIDNPEDVGLMDDLNRTVLARGLTQPEVRSASVIQYFDPSLDINFVAQEMRDQSAEIRKGNMGRAEEMLIAQAHSLDALFANLARKAHGNMEAGYLQATETYMRLALRAQNQCRTTLETLSAIKNPPVIYAKQANFANGPQQINNGVEPNPEPMAKGVTHALENETDQNKLGGSSNELLPNPRTLETVGRTMQGAEALGEVHRAEN